MSDIPDPIAEFDQLLRGMKDWARLMRTYYDELRAAGFDKGQAMQLTVGYQQGLQMMQAAQSAGE